MQKKAITILAFLICLISLNLSAQDQSGATSGMQPALNARTGGTLTVSSGISETNTANTNIWDVNNRMYNLNNSVQGNRFFYDDTFHKGELWTKTGYFSAELEYKFDQLEGTVLAKSANGKEILIDEKTVLMFYLYINDTKIVFVKNDIPKGDKDVLMQVMYYSNTLQMLRNAKKTLVKEGASMVIKNDYNYYIRENDAKPLEAIELTEKSFINKFPNHRSKIVSFFKANAKKDDLNQTKLIQLLDKITGQQERSGEDE
jgi:hypothetical protein